MFFMCLQELPVAFVTFKSRMSAALVAQSQQHSHPLFWTTEMAPEPRDVSWRSLAIPYRLLPLCKLAVILASALLTIFFAIPVTAAQGIARFEKLKKWFPPAMAVQLMYAFLVVLFINVIFSSPSPNIFSCFYAELPVSQNL